MVNNRLRFPDNTIIYCEDIEKMEYTYKLRTACGSGGSGIVYRAYLLDKEGNHDTDVCIKEFYPSSGFTRNTSDWTLICDDLDEYGTDYIQKLFDIASKEMSTGKILQNSTEVLMGNMQIKPIKKLVFAHKISIPGKEIIDISSDKELFAIMEDLSFTHTIPQLINLIKKNYNDEQEVIDSSGSDRLNPYAPLLNSNHRDLSAYAIFQLILEVLNALKFIHEKGYIHGDIQPDNIMFGAENLKNYKLGTAMFVDFGASLKLDGNGEVDKPTPVFSTPNYIAPEQWQGNKLSRATDIFQVGALLLYLLTGEIDNPQKSLRLYDTSKLSYCGIRLEDCDGLYSVIEKALAKDMHNRYASVDEFYDELNKYAKKYQPSFFRLDKYTFIPQKCIGREGELSDLEKMLKGSANRIFVWSEERGIGKTTLMQLFAGRENYGHKRNVYIIKFKNNMHDTIADAPATGELDSFDKYSIKLNLLKELSSEDVVIIDNFYSDKCSTIGELQDKEYWELVNSVSANIIFTTNYNLSHYTGAYKLVPLSREILYQDLSEVEIFTNCSKETKDRLLNAVKMHTMLYVIAKNILLFNPTITIEALIDKIEQRDLGSLNAHLYDFEKDNMSSSDVAVCNLLDELYRLDAMTKEQRMVLTYLDFVSESGISFELFCDVLCSLSESGTSGEEKSSDENKQKWIKIINELCLKGWIKKKYNGECYMFAPLHDLISMVLHNREVVDSIFLSNIIRNAYSLLTSENKYYENSHNYDTLSSGMRVKKMTIAGTGLWLTFVDSVLKYYKAKDDKKNYHAVSYAALKASAKDNYLINPDDEYKDNYLFLIKFLTEHQCDLYFHREILSLINVAEKSLKSEKKVIVTDSAYYHIRNGEYDKAEECFDILTCQDDIPNYTDHITYSAIWEEILSELWPLSDDIFIYRVRSYQTTTVWHKAIVAFCSVGEEDRAEKYYIQYLQGYPKYDSFLNVASKDKIREKMHEFYIKVNEEKTNKSCFLTYLERRGENKL